MLIYGKQKSSACFLVVLEPLRASTSASLPGFWNIAHARLTSLDRLVVDVTVDRDQVRPDITAPALLGIAVNALDQPHRLTLGKVVAFEIEIDVRRGDQGFKAIVSVGQVLEGLEIGGSAAIGLVRILQGRYQLLDHSLILGRHKSAVNRRSDKPIWKVTAGNRIAVDLSTYRWLLNCEFETHRLKRRNDGCPGRANRQET